MKILLLIAFFVFAMFSLSNLTRTIYRNTIPAANVIWWAASGTFLFWYYVVR
jgi:hypothetical protein